MRRVRSLGLALSVAIAIGASARADFVVYSANGVFASTGTSIFAAANGAIIEYTPFSGVANASPTTGASFGTFTNLTPGGFGGPVSDTFTLTITEASPDTGAIAFTGTLTGTLFFDSSSAHIDFTPLSLSISTPTDPTMPRVTTFSIVSADHGTPGRLDLVPVTTNNPPGQSTLQGEINVVPEPSALALLAIGGPTAFALRYRRKRRINAELLSA